MREERRWGVGGGGSDLTYQTCFEEDHSVCKNRKKTVQVGAKSQ